MSDTTSLKYTVAEIDSLRRVMDNKYLYGCYNPQFYDNGCISRSYREEEKVKVVEEWVRTAMLAGHRAEDFHS